MPLEGLSARLATDDLALAILTDEELVALGQPLHPDGPIGWFAQRDEHERTIAAEAALRSLVARGLLRPTDTTGRLEAHPSLELLRSARREALAVTLVERETGDGVDRALLHQVADGIVLEELLDRDGLHAFTVRSPQRCVQALALRCDPEAVAGEPDDPDVRGPRPTSALLDEVDRLAGAAGVRTRLTTLRRRDRDGAAPRMLASLTVLATPTGVWAVAARPGDGEGTVDGLASLAVSRLGATALTRTLLGVLDPVIDAAQTSRGAGDA